MRTFSTSKQKHKSNKKQYSFSDLSQTTTAGESTKKSIQTEDITLFQLEPTKDSKISFSLPYNVSISNIISRLTNLFSEEIIHVEEDNQGGKIMISGVKGTGKRRILVNILDCLGIFCWKYGLNGGSLHDTYSVISISIKKEILNNRCLLSIEQQPYHHEDKRAFVETVVVRIQQQLKKIDLTEERLVEGHLSTRYLSYDSIFLQQLEVKQRIYDIFVYENDKRWQRFRRLFKRSEETIRQKMQQLRIDTKNEQEQNTSIKKQKCSKNPSVLIEAVINETDNLFKILQTYYQKEVENQYQYAYLSSILQTITQKQYTLYSIEELLSSFFMDSILKFYQINTEQQCILFNRNSKDILRKLGNKELFDYLELRDKFRLEKLSHPYHPSVQMLKSITLSNSPRQMLLTVQKVFSSVKVDCLKATNGRTELSSMDDLLPVMIFVTAKAEVHNFPAIVKLVDDYIRMKGIFELEERIITTLYVAVQDITKKWNR